MLRVATRCTSLDEFLATFSRFVDDTSVTIITSQPRAVGTRQPFAIQLKDGETVMRGECEVIEANGRVGGGRPSMRLKLVQMDDETRALHKELLSRAKRGTLLGIPAMGRAVPPPVPAAALVDKPAAPAEAKPVDDGWDDGPSANRTPGASYTLPANPFGELPDEALEYFVECTLYEDTGLHPLSEVLGAERADGAVTASGAISAPPAAPAPPAFVPAATPPRPTTPPPVTASPAAPTLSVPPLPPDGADADLAGYVGAQAGASEPPAGERAFRFVDPDDPEPGRVDTSYTMPVVRGEGRRRRSWLLPAFLAGVFAGGLGFIGGYLGRGGGNQTTTDGSAARASLEPAAPAAPSTPTAGPAAVTPSAPDPAPSAPVDPPKTDEAGASEPVALKGTCIATVSSEPSGAPVFWGKQRLGETPLSDVEIPCGPGKIIFDHPRYETVERSVTARPDRRVAVAERLIRPAGRIDLVSSPSGASFTVDGKSVGGSAAVSAFTHISVTAKLAGHKPWSEKVYVKGRKMTVMAKLEALAKPKPTPRKPGSK